MMWEVLIPHSCASPPCKRLTSHCPWLSDTRCLSGRVYFLLSLTPGSAREMEAEVTLRQLPEALSATCGLARRLSVLPLPGEVHPAMGCSSSPDLTVRKAHGTHLQPTRKVTKKSALVWVWGEGVGGSVVPTTCKYRVRCVERI